MHRTRTAAALCVLLVVAAVAPAPVAADDDGIVSDLLDGEDDGTDWSALAGGIFDRLSYGVSNALDSDPETGEDDAQAVQEYLNDNTATFIADLNNRTTATEDFDVLEVTFDRNDERETIYLVANVSNGTYTDGRVVDETDRTVDRELTLTDYASANAETEVRYYHENFAKTGDAVNASYVSRLGGRYKGHIEDAEWLTG